MKDNTKSKYFIMGASILMLCNPMAQADWRDYVSSIKMPFTRQDMTNMIWSKYGAIGGTFVIMAMAAGLWVKSGRSLFGFGSQQGVMFTNEQIKEAIAKVDTAVITTMLDQIYAEQRWPNIANFHSFIISLLNRPEINNQEKLVSLIQETFKTTTVDQAPDNVVRLCYILLKEGEILRLLADEQLRQIPNLNEASALLTALTPKIASSIANSIDKELTSDANAETCINALDILYAIERLPQNFSTAISQKLEKTKLGKIKKDDLINLVKLKDENSLKLLNDTLAVEKNTIKSVKFTDKANHELIERILNRLIEQTKSEKAKMAEVEEAKQAEAEHRSLGAGEEPNN